MIAKDSLFFKQARLLLQLIPVIAQDRRFALKGGTAINFFIRKMPRLSVDINLTYLPLDSRQTSLQAISEGLTEMARQISGKFPAWRVVRLNNPGMQGLAKLSIRSQDAQILIEPHLIIRGSVFPVQERDLTPKTSAFFEISAAMQILSTGDLYGGKLCAALDRQHPRDFFDLLILLENEGLTDEIRKAFVVYLACSNRPMSEILAPKEMDFSGVFERQFRGMAERQVTCEELVHVRKKVISAVRSSLTAPERQFLLSIKSGTPKWNLLEIPEIERLPAIRWKLDNIKRMEKKEHNTAMAKLARVLELN
jgi:predicted nucleotidyltransferase component of viral defense system